MDIDTFPMLFTIFCLFCLAAMAAVAGAAINAKIWDIAKQPLRLIGNNTMYFFIGFVMVIALLLFLVALMKREGGARCPRLEGLQRQ